MLSTNELQPGPSDSTNKLVRNVNYVIRSIESQLRNVLHYDAVKRFLQNELSYFNMARTELIGSNTTAIHAGRYTGRIMAPSRHVASTLKRTRHISGLNDCSSFLNSITNADDQPMDDDCRSPPAIRRRGVVNKYEYYGPPLPIDDLMLGDDAAIRVGRSASSSGCSASCSDTHEQCEVKYAELERQIAALRGELARIAAAGAPATFSVASTTPTAAAVPPPPAPPLPPPGFLTSRASNGTPKVKICRAKSDIISASTPRGRLSPMGDADIETRRQMLKVLADLKAGRTTLKPVLKSPGGTPRKRALALYHTSKTCHDLLADALRSKFANVHRLQKLSSSNNDPGGVSSVSDCEDTRGDDSWATDSDPTSSRRQSFDSPGGTRPRIYTIY